MHSAAFDSFTPPIAITGILTAVHTVASSAIPCGAPNGIFEGVSIDRARSTCSCAPALSASFAPSRLWQETPIMKSARSIRLTAPSHGVARRNRRVAQMHACRACRQSHIQAIVDDHARDAMPSRLVVRARANRSPRHPFRGSAPSRRLPRRTVRIFSSSAATERSPARDLRSVT